MNPLVKKEIRLLLPGWIASMVLVVAPVIFLLPLNKVDAMAIVGDHDAPLWMECALLLGVLFLGIGCFGQEFSFRTFSLLLSQPAGRRRIWTTKIFVLALAFVSTLWAALAAWTVYFHLHRELQWTAFSFVFHYPEIILLGMLVLFTGGLWTTLLLRQVSGAFWFTALIPGALAAAIYQVTYYCHRSDTFGDIAVAIALLAYSAAGFFWARRLFFRAQEIHWTGGNVFFPWRKNARTQSTSFVFGAPRHRLLTLVWKEIQFQEASLFITVVLFAGHLATVVGRLTISNPNARMIFDNYWSLWLLMPLIIGSTAVAEERRGGTLESQLCLPVSRNTQFSIKFFIGLVLSLVLGAAVPSLIERTHDFGQTGWIPYWIFIAAPTIYFIAFYASTLARTTLQAMGMAIGIPLAIGASLAGLVGWYMNHFVDDNGWIRLALLVGVPALPLLLARLMFWNFKWLHQDWKLWRRNTGVLVGFFFLALVLSNGLYFRTWELLMRPDYPHGPAQLKFQSVKTPFGNDPLTAILPDGRLWMYTPQYHQSLFGGLGTTYRPGHSQFAPGSNWMAVASGWTDLLALRSDGTLWHLPKTWPPKPTVSMNDFSRIGSDTDWQQVAGCGSRYGFLLLKKDGSLWSWGTNSAHNLAQKHLADSKSPPARIGNNMNWTELFSVGYLPYAKNSKGENFAWDWNVEADAQYRLSLGKRTSTRWQTFYVGGRGPLTPAVGKGTNDDLWLSNGDRKGAEYVPSVEIPIGRGAKWKAFELIEPSARIIALRSDGTLWKSSSFRKWDGTSDQIQMTQMGNHSDWIALFSGYWNGFAIAADGSVWSWGEPSYFLLGPSRRPVYIGNLLQATD